MGNETRAENWAARERLRFIERAVWWRGWIGRKDLVDLFGISAAQASGDLQAYQKLNPGALVYQMSRKRYEGAASMSCELHDPSLDDGIALFLSDGESVRVKADVSESSQVAVVTLPQREVTPKVERALFVAVCQKLSISVKYHSVSQGEVRWRELLPRAFGHDGLRWHARAWCAERQGWRDFVLGRISDTKWPVQTEIDPGKDQEWESLETMRYRINPALAENKRAALAMDYKVSDDGILVIHCRKAMRQYVDAMLRVQGNGKRLPAHFVRE